MNQSIDIENIASLLWNLYDSRPAKQLIQLPKGFKNKSFLVNSADDINYVLKIYAANFLSTAEIERRAKIVKSLEQNNLPVLEMILGLDQRYCQTIEVANEYYSATVSKYIDVPLGETSINLDTITTVARTLQELHSNLGQVGNLKAFRRLNIESTLNQLTSNDSIAKIEEYFVTDPQRKHRAKELVKYYLLKGEELKKYFSRRKDLFKVSQLCHGDFNLDNFLMIDSHIEKIFDFDEMILAPKEYEVALTIYHLDYAQETYLDRLIELFVTTYFQSAEITSQLITDIIMFMKYRAYYRLGRYFTYYQFTDKPGGHFTKFTQKLVSLEQLDVEEILGFINSKS